MRVAAVFFLVFPASLAGMFACIARAPPKSKPAEGGAYDEESAQMKVTLAMDKEVAGRIFRLSVPKDCQMSGSTVQKLTQEPERSGTFAVINGSLHMPDKLNAALAQQLST